MNDRLLEGATRLVATAGVRPGLHVVLHVDTGHDNDVVPAIAQAVAEAGAALEIVRTGNWDKWSETEAPELRDAVERADILIGQGEYLRAELPYIARARFERGLVFINNEAKVAEALASQYALLPAPELQQIGLGIADALVAAGTVQVTTPAGTDLRFSVRAETIGGYWYRYDLDGPGHKKGWPGGILCFLPVDADGSIALTRLAPSRDWRARKLDPPLVMVVRQGRVVTLDGDGADEIAAYWDREGDDGSRLAAKALLGIHPGADAFGARAAASPRSVNFGFGDTTRYGGTAFSRTWVQGFDDDPTVRVDGKRLYHAGRLDRALTDPPHREVPPAPTIAPLASPPATPAARRLAAAIEAERDDPQIARLPRQVYDIEIDGEPAFSVSTGDGRAVIGRRTEAPALLRSGSLLGSAEAFEAVLTGKNTFTDLHETGDLRLAARLYGGSSLTRLLTKAARTRTGAPNQQ